MLISLFLLWWYFIFLNLDLLFVLFLLGRYTPKLSLTVLSSRIWRLCPLCARNKGNMEIPKTGDDTFPQESCKEQLPHLPPPQSEEPAPWLTLPSHTSADPGVLMLFNLDEGRLTSACCFSSACSYLRYLLSHLFVSFFTMRSGDNLGIWKHVRSYISSYFLIFPCLCLWLFLWLCSSVTPYLSQHGLSCAVVTNNCKVVYCLLIARFIFHSPVKSWVSRIGSAPHNLVLGPRPPGALLGTRAEGKRSRGILHQSSALAQKWYTLPSWRTWPIQQGPHQGDWQYRAVTGLDWGRWKHLVNSSSHALNENKRDTHEGAHLASSPTSPNKHYYTPNLRLRILSLHFKAQG